MPCSSLAPPPTFLIIMKMTHSKILTMFFLISVTLFTPSLLPTPAAERTIHLTSYKTTFIFLAFYTTSIFALSDHRQGSEECARIAKFQQCLSKSSSPASMLTTPHSNSSLYNKLNQPWNTRKPKATPIGYFLPISTPDVQNAVRCGVLANIKLIPNSGGHSYEGISWGDDNSIVIDFTQMRKISLAKEEENEFNVKTPVAIIQAGALLGPVYAQLWTLGRVGIPVGSCLTVALGGHAIGGGVGYFSQTFGLAVDNILQVEMVDASGNAIIASTTQNKELFWGVRGMGPGYLGIVTKFWMKTFRADELKFTHVKMVYKVQDFVQIVQAHQEWLKWTRIHESGAVAWFSIEGTSKSDRKVLVELVHIFHPIRNPHSNSTFLTKLDEIYPPSTDKTVAYPSYLPFISVTSDYPQKNLQSGSRKEDGQGFNSKANKWPKDEDILKHFNMARKGEESHRYLYAKNLYVKRYLTLDELSRLGQVLNTTPNNSFSFYIGPEGGEVHKVAKSATSYVHRDSLWTFHIMLDVLPEEGEGAVGRGLAWLNSLWAAAQSFDGGETYQNYPDLAVKDFLKRHYGSNLDRLVKLKRVWDPQNYFTNPMSIPVQLDEGCDKE